jgi:hypothetical protein
MPFYSLTSSGGLVEAATFAALPATGATGTLYVVTATNTLYRWSGSAYVEVSASPAEVVEAANLAAFPATGAAGKIYVALDTGKAYRWGGSAYAEISAGDWATISNKPSTFAPSAHAASHASGGEDSVTLAVSQVTGLQTALDGKAATSHSHGNITSAGAIGTASGRMVMTSTSGVLVAAAQNATLTSRQVNLVGGYDVSPLTFPDYTEQTTAWTGNVAAGNVTGLASIATTGSAADITTGTLAAARLPTTTVTSAAYGSASSVATFTVGADGRLTAAGSTAISIAASGISSGTIATARLASGTASESTFLRGDQTWATISTYTLPAATTSTLGGVIVGGGLSVSSGTVSANVASVAGRTGAVTISHTDVGNSPSTLTQFTAAQNNLSLGTGGIVRISSSAAVNITGFAATSGGDARMLSNVGSFAITLKHSDAASTAANRILCVGNADVVIAAGGSAVVYYDATDSRWRVG